MSITIKCLKIHHHIFNFYRLRRKYLDISMSWLSPIRLITIVNITIIINLLDINLPINILKHSHIRRRGVGLRNWTVARKGHRLSRQRKDCTNHCFWIGMWNLRKGNIRLPNLCLLLRELLINPSILMISWRTTKILLTTIKKTKKV